MSLFGNQALLRGISHYLTLQELETGPCAFIMSNLHFYKQLSFSTQLPVTAVRTQWQKEKVRVYFRKGLVSISACMFLRPESLQQPPNIILSLEAPEGVPHSSLLNPSATRSRLSTDPYHLHPELTGIHQAQIQLHSSNRTRVKNVMSLDWPLVTAQTYDQQSGQEYGHGNGYISLNLTYISSLKSARLKRIMFLRTQTDHNTILLLPSYARTGSLD